MRDPNTVPGSWLQQGSQGIQGVSQELLPGIDGNYNADFPSMPKVIVFVKRLLNFRHLMTTVSPGTLLNWGV